MQLATENRIPPSSSPEGTNTLASGTQDHTVIILDVASGEQKAQLKGHTDYVMSVAWGPEGTGPTETGGRRHRVARIIKKGRFVCNFFLLI